MAIIQIIPMNHCFIHFQLTSSIAKRFFSLTMAWLHTVDLDKLKKNNPNDKTLENTYLLNVFFFVFSSHDLFNISYGY